MSETFSWLKYVTFFGFYESAPSIQRVEANPMTMFHLLIFDETGSAGGLGPLANNIVLLGLGFALLFWGARVFQQRDLPAPL